MPFDHKLIRPNRRLTEGRLTKKIIWPKTKFIKSSFDQKYLENGNLAENLT
jgi:hypothetical protein